MPSCRVGCQPNREQGFIPGRGGNRLDPNSVLSGNCASESDNDRLQPGEQKVSGTFFVFSGPSTRAEGRLQPEPGGRLLLPTRISKWLATAQCRSESSSAAVCGLFTRPGHPRGMATGQALSTGLSAAKRSWRCHKLPQGQASARRTRPARRALRST